MNDKQSGGRANIGTSSLILIFIILCLTIFGLLSLSSAGSDWNLAQKNAQSIKGYYEADSQAVEFAAMVEAELLECALSSSSEEVYQHMVKERMKEKLGGCYDETSNTVWKDVDMLYGQKLHVELEITGEEERGYRILAWNVYQSEDYEIDRSMPVWSGS